MAPDPRRLPANLLTGMVKNFRAEPECPKHLQKFWALFEPLAKRIDPIQLWTDMLDMLIGNMMVVEELGIPIDICEGQIKRDYDRAVLSLAAKDDIKQECTKILCELMRVIAYHNYPKSRQLNADDWVGLISVAAAAPYSNSAKNKPRWIDVFGDIHNWLTQVYDRAALVPCCAPVAQTEQWTLAQLRGLTTNHEGQPISINNRLQALNNDCGSGRTTICMQAHRPGWFTFVGQSTNHLHCRYTVLNMLLHGCYGQVTLVDERQHTMHIRTWDINRWYHSIGAPREVLAWAPHVFDANKSISHAHRHYVDKDNRERPDAEKDLRKLQMEMLNRLSDGLGIGIEVADSIEDLSLVKQRQELASSVVNRPPASGKAKSLTQRLLARQQQMQTQRKAVVESLRNPAPPTPAPAPETPKPRTMARRRS